MKIIVHLIIHLFHDFAFAHDGILISYVEVNHNSDTCEAPGALSSGS